MTLSERTASSRLTVDDDGKPEQTRELDMSPEITDRDTPRSPSRNEEFGLLVDAGEDYAIFLLSPEGNIRTWNTGAKRILGYEEKEVSGRHFSLFYGPEDVAAD